MDEYDPEKPYIVWTTLKDKEMSSLTSVSRKKEFPRVNFPDGLLVNGKPPQTIIRDGRVFYWAGSGGWHAYFYHEIKESVYQWEKSNDA